MPCVYSSLSFARPLFSVLPLALCLIQSRLLAADPINAPQPEQPVPVDKSGYTLFHPTPASLLRELSTDRPDQTESPYTVDAGHFQLEMDILNYGYDRNTPARDNTRLEHVSIATVNLKLGLLNNVDLQLVIDSYTSTRAHDRSSGSVETHRGFGDIASRLKLNLWGNDGGPTAGALLPFVKLPTNQDGLGNKSFEGGIIFPFAMSLPYGFGMGLMTEVDAARDLSKNGYHPEFANSVTLSRDIIGKLAGYVEFFSRVSSESGSSWIGMFDVGFTYGLAENIQLDAGANIGLTRAAEDINPFVGLSWRF